MANNFTYKMNIDGDIGNLLGKLKILKDQLASITSDGKEPKITKMLDQLGARIDAIKSKASAPIKSEAAFGSIEKDIQGVYRVLENLGTELDSIAKKANSSKIEFLPESQRKILLGIVSAMEEYNNAIDASTRKSKELLKAEGDLAKAENKLIADKQKLANLEKTADSAKQARDTAKAALDEAKGRQEAAEAAQKQLERIQKLADAAKKAEKKGGEKVDLRSAKFDDGNGGQMTLQQARSNAAKTAANIPDLEEITRLNDAYKEANATATQLTTRVGTLKASIEQQNSAIALARDKVGDLTSSFDASRLKASEDAFTTLRQKVKDLGVSMEGIGTENITENIDLLKQRMEEFVAVGVAPVDDQMRTVSATMGEISAATDQAAESTRRSTEEFREQNEAAGEVSGLMQRIKQFTGLTGAALIARRALRDAIETTKELDKQMTEMAVVTNLEVGDFWNQLPEHTERANALGVAINEVYKAETLYYQQGLKAAQVTQLSTSTLKMARIAGLSAEDATNKMTAALRGFNMEINETNANRIADVYSKLAAITASNVQEISSAMTKTASIASSAGMKFETTAAFLSQIIETTRESAETAGTALKTVIARFQELKKSPDEIGEVDGEIIDANKIETALRTVGVALRDTSGQFRELDDVFMELAQKWDTLDMNTQRYIATIAAGSRQQSRFVAMMSDYSRTQELVNAANNAAGASNEQFEKTIESLETKLNKLKNAWDTFTQGLANNQFIKMAVDILTGLLTAINKVTEGFGPWSGSALKIGLVTAALIAGDKALKIFTQSLKGGSSVLGAFGNTFKTAGSSVKNLVLRLTAWSKTMKAHNTITRDGIAAIQARKKAEQALSNANATVATHENRIAALRAQSNIVTNEQVEEETKLKIAKTQQAAASEGVVKAQEEEILALGLSATQQKVYSTMVSAGVHEETAAILAKKGLTNASWANMQAAYGEAAGAHASELAQKLQNAGLIKGTFIKWNDQIATIAQAAAHGTYTGSLITATIAQLAYNISVKLGCPPVLVLTAAIILLTAAIIGIVAAFRAMANETPEANFEKANKALKEATERADAAKESYNNLVSALDQLQEKYDALDKLTVGTREWRDAMVEVNSEVLDLIDNYPQLAGLVNNEDGILKISEEDIEDAKDASLANVAKTSSAKLNAQINRTKALNDLRFSQLSEDATAGREVGAAWAGGAAGAAANILGLSGITSGIYSATAHGIGSGTSWVDAIVSSIGGPIGAAIIGAIRGSEKARNDSQEFTDAFARALAAGDITNDNMEKWLKEKTNLSDSAIDHWIENIGDISSETAQELREYGAQLNAADAELKTCMQGIINNAMMLVDVNKYTQEQLTQMSNIGTDVAKKQLDKTKAQVNDLGKNKDLDDSVDYTKYWEDQYGGSVKISGNGEITYKDEEGKEQVIEADQAREEYSSAKATEELTKKLEALPKALSGVDQTLRELGNGAKYTAKQAENSEKALNHLYNDETGLGITRQDLGALSGQMLADIYAADENWQAIYDTYEEFAKEMEKRAKAAQKAYKANTEQLKAIGLGDVSFDRSISAKSEKDLVEKLSQMTGLSGSAAAESLNKQINNILASVAEEDRNAVVAQLTSIDWHDLDELEGLPDLFKEIGKNVPEGALQSFIAEAKEVAHAVRNVDLTKLNEQLKDLNAIINNIRTGSQKRTFDDSSYEALITASPELKQWFTQDLEGNWIYLGSSLEALTAAVDKNTLAVNERVTELKNKTNAANILDALKTSGQRTSSGTLLNVEKIANADYNSQREFIKAFIEQANKNGISLEGVSSKISNKTNVNDLKSESIFSKSDIDTIINELRGINGQQQVYQKEIETSAIQALTTNRLSSNVYFNVRDSVTNKAEEANRRNELTQDEIAKYASARRATIVQAQNAGVQETDIKLLHDYEEQLRGLEEVGLTDSEIYKTMAKRFNDLAKSVSKTTGYEGMRTALQENVSEVNELIEAYKKTSQEEERRYLVSQMVSDFGIKATKENYELLAAYTNDYLQGSKSGFENLINLSAISWGIITEEGEESAYEVLNSQLTYQELVEQGYGNMAKDLADKGYAWIDTETNKFRLGSADLIDIAKNTVEQIEKWESPYDWLYNLNQMTNAEIRKRTQLEAKYQRILDSNVISSEDLAENLKKQSESIRNSMILEENRYKNAESSLRNLVNSTELPQEFRDFIHVGANGQISIDSSALDELNWTNDMGAVYEEFVGQIEEWRDIMTDSLDNLQDLYEEAKEKKYTGKTEYEDLISRVATALQTVRQQEIDKLSEINNSINNAQSALIDKIQAQIDAERQARENAKTEKNIADSEASILALIATGGSQTEILTAQQALEEQKQSYTDSLLDQSIQQVQEANQQAADQRQQQIDIAQAQLDYWSENNSKHQAETMVQEFLEKGQAFETSQLGSLLTEVETKNLTNDEMQDWKKDSTITVEQAKIWNNKTAFDYYSEVEKDLAEKIVSYTDQLSSLNEGNASIKNDVKPDGTLSGSIGSLKTVVDEINTDIKDMKTDWKTAQAAYISSSNTINTAANTFNEAVNNYKEATKNLQEIQDAKLAKLTKMGEPFKEFGAMKYFRNRDNYSSGSKVSGDLNEALSLKFNEIGAKFLSSDNGQTIYQLTSNGAIMQYNKIDKPSSGGEQPEVDDLGAGIILVDYDAAHNDWNNDSWNTDDVKNGEYESGRAYFGSQEITLESIGKPNEEIGKKALAAGAQPNQLFTYKGHAYFLGDTSIYGKAVQLTDGDDFDKIKHLFKYKQGGMVEFTGPAWLDGTKSAPEAVLNATDTRNFIELRDILADIMRGATSTSNSTNNQGNNYYDIDIAVDSLESDYDVDRLADHVKEMIVNDAMYRNVNAIEQIR